MEVLGRWVCRLLVLALACAGSTASADDAHHRNNLLGDRALGTGGAWTGLGDDPSAAYYNPGGLAIVSRRSLSASMQLDGFEHVEIDSALQGISEDDLIYDQRVTIPVFVSGAIKFGARDENKFQQHAFAFSTFHPSHRATRFQLSLRAPGEGDIVMRYEDISVADEDNTIWIGPSYAFAFNSGHAVGLSVFMSDRSLVHNESRARVDEGMGDEVVGNAEYFVVRRTIAELSAKHVVVRLGWIYQLAPSVRLGLMFQPPGIQLSASSRRSYRRIGTSDDGIGAFHKTIEADDLPADSPIPWEVRLGVGVMLSSVTRLDLDGALTGPNGSVDDPVQLFGTDGRDDLEPPGVLIAETFSRELTPNFNLGVETLISDLVMLRGGIFTDLSAVPAVHAGDTYELPDVARFGASMSVGLKFGDVDMTFGGFIRWGRGETLGIDTREDAENFYVPRTIEDRTIAFFISGQLSSAKKLLGSAAKGVFGSTEEEEEEDEDEDEEDGEPKGKQKEEAKQPPKGESQDVPKKDEPATPPAEPEPSP